MELRPYQQEAKEAIQAEWEKGNNLIGTTYRDWKNYSFYKIS